MAKVIVRAKTVPDEQPRSGGFGQEHDELKADLVEALIGRASWSPHIGVEEMATAGSAAIVQATKASGVLVELEPEQFQKLLYRVREPLLIMAPPRGILRSKFQYLMSYKGIAFYTNSSDQLHTSGGAEVVEVKKIWVP